MKHNDETNKRKLNSSLKQGATAPIIEYSMVKSVQSEAHFAWRKLKWN